MAKKVTERIISINTQGAENSIKALREQIKSLTAVQKELDIESEDFAHITQELTAAQTQLRNAMQGNTAAVEGSYKAYSHQLQVLKEQRKWMREGTDEYIRATQEIGKLDTKLKQMDAEIGVFGRNVGNYASAFDGLTSSVQNVAKELPVLGKGTSDFFTATKDSLPTLFESIEGFKQMSKETGGATSAIGAMLKSMLSWQTAIMVGVSLLAEYGDEIVAWVKSIGKGKESLDSTAKATEAFNKSLSENSFGIGELVTQFNILQNAWVSLGDNTKAKEQYIYDNAEAFNALGFEINSVAEAEALLIDNAGAFINAMELKAKATAAQNLAISANERVFNLSNQLNNTPATLQDSGLRFNSAGVLEWQRWTETNPEYVRISNELKAAQGEAAAFMQMYAQQFADYQATLSAIPVRKTTTPKYSVSPYSGRTSSSSTSSTQSLKVDAAGMYENSWGWGSGMAIGSLGSMTEGIDQSSAIEAQKARLAAMVQMERASAEERKTIEQNLDSELAIIEEARLTAHEIVLREMLRSDELSAEERLDIEQQLTDNQLAQIKLRMDAEKKAEAEKEALAKKRVTIEQQTTSAVSNILKASAGMMEENSKEQKALSAAALLVDTYASAMSGWRAGMQIGGVAGPIVAGINVAASLAMGALQLKNLLDVREDGSNATRVNASVPNVASTMPAAYTRNLMGDSELSELNKDTRVYVVESDITEAQNASRVRVESASF